MGNDIAERVNPETGELTPITQTEAPLAVQVAQAELNQAVTTARAFPRSIATAMRNIRDLATLDDKTAEECVYALPRAGKAIRGPSVRLAEIIVSCWGNCHVGARVVHVDRFEKVVVAEGVFHDLETGMRRTHQTQRRIVDKHGRLYNDDMITTTGNAAASIAFREAVLKGVPRAIWRNAYESCERVIAGDVTTLVERRDRAIKAFAAWGVTPERIFAALDIGGLEDIGADELVTLTAWRSGIKNNEQTVEEVFPEVRPGKPEAAKGTAQKLADIAAGGDATGAQTEGPEQAKADEPAAEAKPKAAAAEPESKPEPKSAKAKAEPKTDAKPAYVPPAFPGDTPMPKREGQ